MLKITNKKRTMAVLVLVLFVIFLFWNKTKTPDQAFITIKRGDITEKVIAVGSIVPKHTISIKSTIPGTVGQLFHEEGDYIEQGALLLQVTPAPTPESIAEANEAVQENRAILLQAQSHQERLAQLLKLKLESPDDYAIAAKDVAMSKAKLEMAQQKLSLIQKGETTIAGKEIKTMINSPISGYILQRNVDEGDPVVPLTEAQEGTVLLVVANMQDLIFKGSVNEIDVGKISSGMPADISIAALPDIKVTGFLRKIDLQAITSTTATINNTSAPFNVGFNIELNHLQIPKGIKLRAGYSATAEIIVKKAEGVLIVPERVIIFKDNKTFVSILSKNKKPMLQEIILGMSDGINAQVLSGVFEGQRILENNSQNNLTS